VSTSKTSLKAFRQVATVMTASAKPCLLRLIDMTSRKGRGIRGSVGDLIVAFRSRGLYGEPSDVLRPIVAFVLSFVFVMTVGAMILSDPGTKPKQSAGALPVPPSLRVFPAEPSLEGPTIDAVSTHHKDPPTLAAPNARTASQERVSPASSISTGLHQATGIAALPVSSVRGGVARVTSITLWGTPSRPWVSISASGPIRYQLRNVKSDWVVVDISRAQLTLLSGGPPAGRGLVKQIRAGQFVPDVVRVVLELTEPVPVHVATSPDKSAIVVVLAAEGRAKGTGRSQPGHRPVAASATIEWGRQ
jgi:hypothetical protein